MSCEVNTGIPASDESSCAPPPLHFRPGERISSRKPPAVKCFCKQRLQKKIESNYLHILLNIFSCEYGFMIIVKQIENKDAHQSQCSLSLSQSSME